MHWSSPIRNAVTLIEVLISMGVLTVGILGVAAMFPAGSFLIGRGETYERADAAAAAALNDAVTKGAVNPENWMIHGTGSGSAFTNYFVEDLRSRLVDRNTAVGSAWNSDPATVPEVTAVQNKSINQYLPTVVVVDPIGVASAMAPRSASAPFRTDLRVSAVPASVGDKFLRSLPALEGAQTTMGPSWYPWKGYWPLRRVTLKSNVWNQALEGYEPVSVAAANQICQIRDDLAVELGDREDLPAQQRVLSDQNLGQLGRASNGAYSWMLTIAPTTYEGRDDLAYGGRSEAYDVSAVVFSRRNVSDSQYDSSDGEFRGHESLMRSERVARGAIVSKSSSGGEIVLHSGAKSPSNGDPWWQDSFDQAKDPWEDLKANNWVMVFGPHPKSTSAKPLLFAQWYRVTSISETEGGSGEPTAVVGLRGPDWPWQAGNDTYPPAGMQDDLRVAIFPDVAAVHTRTMRLDAGTAWNDN